MTTDKTLIEPAELDDAALRTLAQALGERLLAQGQWLATAESCTGGLIAKIITDIPGSSRWFYGGVTSYSNQAKQLWLDVKAETLATHGAVSAAVVIEMATGLLARISPTIASPDNPNPKIWTLSASGIAGPEGGSPDKPVGTVWIGWAGTGCSPSASRYRFPGNRDDVRRATVVAGLRGLMGVVSASL